MKLTFSTEGEGPGGVDAYVEYDSEEGLIEVSDSEGNSVSISADFAVNLLDFIGLVVATHEQE